MTESRATPPASAAEHEAEDPSPLPLKSGDVVSEMVPKAPFWARAWWLAERLANRARAYRQMSLLRRVDIDALSSPVLDDLVVSLTTHGRRFSTVHLTLASILNGSVRPGRIILWVDDGALFESPTEPLAALVHAGLIELRLTENLGPHTKYYPALSEIENDDRVALVTADDDILYPYRWLQRLHESWQLAPHTIHSYRCHRVRFTAPSTLAPYSVWTPAFGTLPHARNFFTGVSGVLHPPLMVRALRERGREFLARCPRADDVWLNSVASDHGIPVRQVSSIPVHFPVIPGSQAEALVSSNIGGMGNDAQIRSTYTPSTIDRIYSGGRAPVDTHPKDLRVTFVDHSGLPGGGQLGLARYLEAAHLSTTRGIVLSGGSAFDRVPANRLLHLGQSRFGWGFLRSVAGLRKALAHDSPDVVVANSPKAGFAIALTPRRRGAVRVYYVRSDLDPTRMSKLKYLVMTRFTLSRFDAFISNSAWTESMIPAFVSDRPRLVAYPVCGLGTEPPLRRSARPDPVFRVLSLSRIASWKGIDVILDAMAELNRRGLEEKVSLTLAGAAHHDDADYEARVRSRVEAHFKNVQMVGHMEDVESLLGASDMLVHASVQAEPFGQTIVQGMRAGLVVIATNLGGPTEIIEDGKTGVLINPGDAVHLADQISRFIEDAELKDSVAHAATQASARFSDEHTIQALNGAVAELYATVLGPHHGALHPAESSRRE